jgi:hypothetical protein
LENGLEVVVDVIVGKPVVDTVVLKVVKERFDVSRTGFDNVVDEIFSSLDIGEKVDPECFGVLHRRLEYFDFCVSGYVTCFVAGVNGEVLLRFFVGVGDVVVEYVGAVDGVDEFCGCSGFRFGGKF